jgi:membrane protein insertase Oxa1/YidC/SpoIIIJ
MFSMFNMLQIPVHLVYISMINRLSFNYNIQPGMLTEGFFWFTDLSSPDPTGILPMIGGVVSLLNILSTSTMNTSVVMRKFRRYVYVFPFISVPIWMTFPAAFNLYWVTTASVQLIAVNMFRADWFRRFCGIPDYLPGSILEAKNVKKTFIAAN